MSFISVLTSDPVSRPIDPATLRQLVPSIFADEPHESRSRLFQPVSTVELLEKMEREGWLVSAAHQQRTRDLDRRPFTKHLVRLRHRSTTGAMLNGTFPEVLLKNGNDGSTSYQISGGFFRLICLNGLVVGSSLQQVKVLHRGNAHDQVIEGSYRVLEGATHLAEVIAPWRGIELTEGEQAAFAERAHEIRFGRRREDGTLELHTPIRPSQLLQARRHDDVGNDLWRVFNRVQENAVNGGLSAIGIGSNGRPRRSTTRALSGIEQNMSVNARLFDLAASFADERT